MNEGVKEGEKKEVEGEVEEWRVAWKLCTWCEAQEVFDCLRGAVNSCKSCAKAYSQINFIRQSILAPLSFSHLPVGYCTTLYSSVLY